MNQAITFKEAVEKTPHLTGGYKAGLGAVKNEYRNKIQVSATRELNGSVDVDGCTKSIYPNEHRWDYTFSYRGKAYFVEFHPARSSEVRTVLNKLKWLKGWLAQYAPAIDELKAKQPYFWVQSEGFDIPRSSPQFRLASQEGLMPIRCILEKMFAG